MRWLALSAAVALIAAASAFAYGGAPATVTASDYAFSPPVTIVAGETVTFAYPAGASRHNVVFTDGGPASCSPALPVNVARPGWTATCTFDRPGEYPFLCGAHPEMTGSVTVTPAPLPTGTATPTTTADPQPTQTPVATPPAAPASRLALTRRQRGQVVRGSIVVAHAGSRITVELRAKRRRAGRITRTAATGTQRFTVRLNASAKASLRRGGRLALTVRITVKPPSGAAFTATRRVTLSRPA